MLQTGGHSPCCRRTKPIDFGCRATHDRHEGGMRDASIDDRIYATLRQARSS